MPFLTPNQQRQSTELNRKTLSNCGKKTNFLTGRYSVYAVAELDHTPRKKQKLLQVVCQSLQSVGLCSQNSWMASAYWYLVVTLNANNNINFLPWLQSIHISFLVFFTVHPSWYSMVHPVSPPKETLAIIEAILHVNKWVLRFYITLDTKYITLEMLFSAKFLDQYWKKLNLSKKQNTPVTHSYYVQI